MVDKKHCNFFERANDDINLTQGRCKLIGHIVRCDGNIDKCRKPRPKI